MPSPTARGGVRLDEIEGALARLDPADGQDVRAEAGASGGAGSGIGGREPFVSHSVGDDGGVEAPARAEFVRDGPRDAEVRVQLDDGPFAAGGQFGGGEVVEAVDGGTQGPAALAGQWAPRAGGSH
ncbi:hypothetical protein ACFZDP_20560 [Streptomyces mirabilis]|uniref:hypothetical protein n=1 Tax=Streptomyces mirabilis TaxID=68239 RepID=UPI0006CCBB3F|nr:hypothetical protein OK006_1249 [Actinobacteria bacterium OK006]